VTGPPSGRRVPRRAATTKMSGMAAALAAELGWSSATRRLSSMAAPGIGISGTRRGMLANIKSNRVPSEQIESGTQPGSLFTSFVTLLLSPSFFYKRDSGSANCKALV